MKLTSEQREACQRLKDALLNMPENADKNDTELDGETCLAFDDNDDHELEDSDDEDEGLELEMGEERQSSLIENPVQRCILDLLVSLFTHLPSGAEDKFYSPIYRFLVLFSLKKDGQWLSGGRISQVFAALLFCAREVVMAMMHHKLIENPALRYSEWVS